MPMCPGIVRLDGMAFHSWTRGLDKPFDKSLVQLMRETAKYLLEETSACIAYTQSDEITLILWQKDYKSQLYFDGKVDKINSSLAGRCATYFNSLIPQYLPAKANKKAHFDCRCFSVPNQEEAVNAVLWRERDAVRNSIQMLGQANFSHKELHKKNTKQIQEMLWQEKKINWNNLEHYLKKGSYFQRREVKKYQPGLMNLSPDVIRNEIIELELPPLSKIINKVGVFFNKEDPKAEEISK